MRNYTVCRRAALICLCLALILAPRAAFASKATSYTYAADENGRFIRTQDAYLPDKTITTLGLNKPSDLFVDDQNMLYIVDTGSRRVLKYDISTGTIAGELKHKEFSTPKGIFVTKAGEIYIADAGARKIFRFGADFEPLATYERPNTPVFADTRFEPMKIAVDSAGHMYVVSEGVYSGVIQLGKSGEFLGYFTVNKTLLSFTQSLQKLLFTREQLENLSPTVPTTFSNVFVDKAGIVYTTTMSVEIDGVKKHRTDGGNMFVNPVFGSDALSDLYVDDQGLIYACDNTGYMLVYSPEGEMVFYFGSFVVNLDIAGLYASLPAIAVDKNGNIWTLDGDKGYLQSFAPTDYARTVYSAMGLYEKGMYAESLEKWNEVLRLNQMSVLAHNGVAKAYFHAEDYRRALTHFRVAGNRGYYSEAFWEVRNEYIQRFLPYAAILIALFVILNAVIKRINKKKGRVGILRRSGAWLMRVPVLRDVLYAIKTPLKPADAFYEIRYSREGTVLGASILYIVYFLIFMLFQTSKGFIYQYVSVEDMDMTALVAGYFVVPLLFIICNYLVTSINDGDGDLKQCYMIPAYSLMPLMGAYLVITLLSYGMTYNESFLLNIIEITAVVWTIVTMFIGLQSVHDYTFKETIKCIVLTLVFMIIAVVMALILFIMGEKLFEFLRTLYEEVLRNVL